MKETILLVHNYYQFAGGEDTVVSNEKRMLEEYGHKVVLFTKDNRELNSSIIKKVLLPFLVLLSQLLFCISTSCIPRSRNMKTEGLQG